MLKKSGAFLVGDHFLHSHDYNLMIIIFDSKVILQGVIICWSLLRIKDRAGILGRISNEELENGLNFPSWTNCDILGLRIDPPSRRSRIARNSGSSTLSAPQSQSFARCYSINLCFFLIFLTRATDFAEKEGFLVVYDILLLGKYFKFIYLLLNVLRSLRIIDDGS